MTDAILIFGLLLVLVNQFIIASSNDKILTRLDQWTENQRETK